MVRAIDARVHRTPEGVLTVSYTVYGDLEHVRVPPPGPARIGHELWRHTCCEMFLRPADGPEYREFNFSPSHEWAAYAFRRYREGGPIDTALDPRIAERRSAMTLELDATVPLDALPPVYSTAPLCVGLSAVIERADGGLSYWALAHAPGKPDFHASEAFALRLE